jgi:hypothetical protein
MAITSCAQANVAQEAANVGKSLASLGKLIGILNIFLGIVGGPEVPDLSNLAGRPLDDVIPPHRRHHRGPADRAQRGAGAVRRRP